MSRTYIHLVYGDSGVRALTGNKLNIACPYINREQFIQCCCTMAAYNQYESTKLTYPDTGNNLPILMATFFNPEIGYAKITHLSKGDKRSIVTTLYQSMRSRLRIRTMS